jgi:hypothetical protein
MKLALECPTALLDRVQPLADFDFVLSHLYLQDPVYRSYYLASPRYKVLDNSVNELLSPLSLSSILEVANQLKPDLIVPPDFLGDSEKTIDSVRQCMSKVRQDGILPVLQGSGHEDIEACAFQLLSTEGLNFSCVAIPYDIDCLRTSSLENMAKSRSYFVDFITQNLDVDIHLLGLTTLEEISSYSDLSEITGIDTGSPILHGLAGLTFGKDQLLDKKQPTYNKMEKLGVPITKDRDPGFLEKVYYNIAYLRMKMEGEQYA